MARFNDSDGVTITGDLTVEGATTLTGALNEQALSVTINSNAAAGTDEDPSLILKGGDGGSEIIRTDIKQDSSADLLYFQMGGGAAGTTRKSPTVVLGVPGETTASMDSTLRFEASSDAGVNRPASIVALGEERRLTVTASNDLRLSDGTAYLDMTAGALTENALASVDLTPSGAMTLRGGGVSQFGDDTGYMAFDGSGAASMSGVTTLGLSGSTSTTITSPTFNLTGNAVINSDATAAATNAPYVQLWDGDAVAAPNDDLIKANVGLDAVNELLELSMTRQRNGGAVAQVGAHLSIGRVGEVTTSIDALLDLRSVNDASAARVATITHLGQEGAVEVSSPTAGLDFALVGTGDLGIKASAADAQVSAGFSGSQINLGAGGASVPDLVFARQAANVGEFASGDSAFIVGAASLGRRNASADANPTVAITANGIEFGAGGASATDVVLARSGANTVGLAAGDTLGVDTIAEVTGAAGVTIDGVTLKDDGIQSLVLGDYANDGAAAGGGVAVGQLYRNGSVVMIRVA